MTDDSLSKDKVTAFRLAIREVAERVVEMLDEQIAANAIDDEAAEDFVIWADERLQEMEDISVEHMTEIAPGTDEIWQGYLDVAVTGRGFIRGQAGDAQTQAYSERYRNMDQVKKMAGLFSAIMQSAEEQNAKTRPE